MFRSYVDLSLAEKADEALVFGFRHSVAVSRNFFELAAVERDDVAPLAGWSVGLKLLEGFRGAGPTQPQA